MNNFKIEKIIAEMVLDSRKKPTLKVSVFALGEIASFMVPSGASTGENEACELRDEDGLGVEKAIFNVNNILAPALVGMNVFSQEEIDRKMIELDGSSNKKNLGANAILGISVAVAKLSAKLSKEETFQYIRTLKEIKNQKKVPYLYMNLINGGKHAKNGLAFQEYMVVPETLDINESIEIGKKIQNSLTEIIKRELGEDSLVVGDEGGYAPKVTDVFKPLYYLKEAIESNHFDKKVWLALDVAGTSFYEDGLYLVNGEKLDKNKMFDLYHNIISNFDILSIEDPFYEKDFESFTEIQNKYQNIIFIGDDLTTTNKDIVAEAIKEKSIKGLIIKLNQIGTLTETLETMKLASEHEVKLIVSHRSGETMDDFIADLALAFGSFGLKSGSPLMKERVVKYERLAKITSL